YDHSRKHSHAGFWNSYFHLPTQGRSGCTRLGDVYGQSCLEEKVHPCYHLTGHPGHHPREAGPLCLLRQDSGIVMVSSCHQWHGRSDHYSFHRGMVRSPVCLPA
ncbi:hypothetical protein FOPG_18059, partial [Fusarium oxysporum f. sp. conglutinans race 2 54008]